MENPCKPVSESSSLSATEAKPMSEIDGSSSVKTSVQKMLYRGNDLSMCVGFGQRITVLRGRKYLKRNRRMCTLPFAFVILALQTVAGKM